MTMQATTTEEQDRHTEAQRTINATWEYTQAMMALSLTFAVIGASFYLPQVPDELGDGFFLMLGFYFGRTNHARWGGLIATARATRPETEGRETKGAER